MALKRMIKMAGVALTLPRAICLFIEDQKKPIKDLEVELDKIEAYSVRALRSVSCFYGFKRKQQ